MARECEAIAQRVQFSVFELYEGALSWREWWPVLQGHLQEPDCLVTLPVCQRCRERAVFLGKGPLPASEADCYIV